MRVFLGLVEGRILPASDQQALCYKTDRPIKSEDPAAGAVSANDKYGLFQSRLSPDQRWVTFLGGTKYSIGDIFISSRAEQNGRGR